MTDGLHDVHLALHPAYVVLIFECARLDDLDGHMLVRWDMLCGDHLAEGATAQSAQEFVVWDAVVEGLLLGSYEGLICIVTHYIYITFSKRLSAVD